MLCITISQNVLFRLLSDSGCRPLGMESRIIQDSHITASTEYSSAYGPRYARLNSAAGAGSWSAGINEINQWLQIDFLDKTTVSKVASQGREQIAQWVKSYSLSYSMDGSNFEDYKKSGEAKVSPTGA